MATEQALQEELELIRKLFNQVCQGNSKINSLSYFLDKNGYSNRAADWFVLFRCGIVEYDRFGYLVYHAEKEGMTVTVLDDEHFEEVEDATGKKTYWKEEIRGGCIFYEEDEAPENKF